MSSRSVIVKIKAEIILLQRQDGSYSPNDLVKFAENNQDSELYKMFVWDDEVAAQEHRLWQAREIITKYAVRIEVGDNIESIPIISVPSLRKSGEGSYLERDVIGANETYRKEVLEEQQTKLRTLRATFEPILPELKSVWRAIGRTC